MFWLFLALLVVLAGILIIGRRRGYESVAAEPWRASLKEDEEPLDLEEIRRAEEEWLEDSGWEEPGASEEWR